MRPVAAAEFGQIILDEANALHHLVVSRHRARLAHRELQQGIQCFVRNPVSFGNLLKLEKQRISARQCGVEDAAGEVVRQFRLVVPVADIVGFFRKHQWRRSHRLVDRSDLSTAQRVAHGHDSTTIYP